MGAHAKQKETDVRESKERQSNPCADTKEDVSSLEDIWQLRSRFSKMSNCVKDLESWQLLLSLSRIFARDISMLRIFSCVSIHAQVRHLKSM